jgi:hypothetical protein
MKGVFFLIVLFVLVLIWLLARRNRTEPGRRTVRRQNEPSSSGPEILRNGEHVPADEMFFASSSKDLERMESAVTLPTRRTDRHFLLLHLCGELYRQRQDSTARAKFLEYAKLHVAEGWSVVFAARPWTGALGGKERTSRRAVGSCRNFSNNDY